MGKIVSLFNALVALLGVFFGAFNAARALLDGHFIVFFLFGFIALLCISLVNISVKEIKQQS